MRQYKEGRILSGMEYQDVSEDMTEFLRTLVRAQQRHILEQICEWLRYDYDEGQLSILYHPNIMKVEISLGDSYDSDEYVIRFRDSTSFRIYIQGYDPYDYLNEFYYDLQKRLDSALSV